MEAAPGVRTTVPAATVAWAEQSLDALLALDGVRRAGIALLEGGGRRLDFTSAEHVGKRPAAWCRVDAYDDVPLNTAVRSGRPVAGTLDELAVSHSAFVGRQAGTGTSALAAVPLIAAGRTLGGFVLFYRDLPGFDDARVRHLVELGTHLGDALDRTRTDAGPGEVLVWMCRPGPDAQVARLAIANRPAAVGPAREELCVTLSGWGFDDDLVETAALCMSELVTNAVVHAASGCHVQVTNDDGTLTVEVRNPGPAPDLTEPHVRDPLEVDGRGLQIVDALTSRWGSSRDASGFSAWFVLKG